MSAWRYRDARLISDLNSENGQNSQSATGDSDSLDYLPYTDTSNSGYKQPDSTTEGCASKNGTCLGLPTSYSGANSASEVNEKMSETAFSDLPWHGQVKSD